MTVVETDSAPTQYDMGALLNPRRIAVVGANDRSEAFTGGTVVNLRRHGYTGEVYPINPRRDVVGGYRAYPDLGSLPGPIDQAVIVVKADSVVPMLDEAVAAGARAAIVISSGFGEGAAGAEGRRRAAQLRDFLSQHPIPLLGPSTTGLVNLNDNFVPRAVTNHLEPARLRTGPVALISQSGAANNAVFNRAQSHGVGVGLAVATGVQADIGVWDIARVAVDDPRITVLAMLVEDLGAPADYESVLRSAARVGKPVVLLRTGRSAVGRSAIATHTGSLAGNWAVEREMMEALGVILAADLDQLWEIAAIATHWGAPPCSRVALGVIGMSGGEGAVIADHADEAGIAMPEVSVAFTELVGEKLTLAGAGNPFDPTGEAIGRQQNALDAMTGFITLNDYDVYLLALNAQAVPAEGGLLDQLLDGLSATGSRIGISYWDIPGYSDGLADRLTTFAGPVLPSSARMIDAIGAWSRGRAVAPGREPERPAAALVADHAVDYWTARSALSEIGVPFADAALVHDGQAAMRAARTIGYPVVLKANVESTVHKAAAGLVRLGVTDEDSVARHFTELCDAGNGVVVEKAVLSTSSLIVGTVFDPHVGSVVMVGSGGGAAEQLRDTAVCPTRLLTASAARDTLRRCAMGRFLEDREPERFTQVAELLIALGRAVDGQMISVDLNPVVVTPTGIVALDARIENSGQQS
ncbi:acetate--CoA ligase family protein [Nocardia sp. NBC_01329]|uniref:acetate--CoA ligase family protein n=1 Tax=Nocardia sp. NBC_01329 TaxID=2903594 RepID=UPI002E0D498F|nr:acetate--CoA ligase family protein [Nocardia sp. NBC_01329]